MRCTVFLFFFTELKEVLDNLGESIATSNKRILRTTDTNRDEASCSPVLRKNLSQKTHKIRKSHALDELGRFFATRPTDAAGKLSHFFSRICRQDFLLPTHGRTRFFATSRLPVISHGNTAWDINTWRRVLDFYENPPSDEQLERQTEKISLALLVKRDRGRVFTEDLLLEESGAAESNLPLLMSLSSPIEVSGQGSSKDLVKMLWSKFS